MGKYKKGCEAIVLCWLMVEYKETGGRATRKGKLTRTFKKWLSNNGYEDLVIWYDKKKIELRSKKID